MIQNLALFLQIDRAREHDEYWQFNYGHIIHTTYAYEKSLQVKGYTNAKNCMSINYENLCINYSRGFRGYGRHQHSSFY